MAQPFPRDFGRYKLVEHLAIGGMAELYRATMTGAHDFHKPVVIKQILPQLAASEEFVSMFINEAKLTAKLMHPKIVQVFELGTMEGRLFISMEFVDGVDLLKMLRHFAKHREKIPPAIGVHIVHEVLDALDYAHQARAEDGKSVGIVHRDISPGNVLVSRRGDVKLTDFGIAHAAEENSKTNTGTLKGKYSYMSPEQIMQADLDGRSDLFACGVVLAEVLMGRRLFTAQSDLDVLLMVRDVRLDRLERFGGHIDPDLMAILKRALRREPNERFGTAREFREALSDWLFNQRKRVSTAEVAALVEAIQAETRDREEPEPELPPGAFEEDSRVEEVEGVPAPTDERRTSGAYAIITTDEAEAELAEEEGDLVLEVGPEPGPERAAPAVAWQDPDPGRKIGGDSVPIFFDEVEPDEQSLDLEISFDEHSGPPASREHSGPPASREASDAEGDFIQVPPIRLLYRLAVSQSNGLLEVSLGSIRKKAYFVRGVPLHVESNVANERLGEYMVARGLISDAELSMALAVMSQMGGQLGDTFIALGLVDALGAVRALTGSIREKMVDVCSWQKGLFRWYEGKESPEETQAIRIEPFEIMGAGAMALGDDHIAGWAQWRAEDVLVPAQNPHVSPEAFRLGPRPHEILSLLDGRRTVESLGKVFPARRMWLDAMRVAYLLVQTELAKFT